MKLGANAFVLDSSFQTGASDPLEHPTNFILDVIEIAIKNSEIMVIPELKK